MDRNCKKLYYDLYMVRQVRSLGQEPYRIIQGEINRDYPHEKKAYEVTTEQIEESRTEDRTEKE